MNKSNSGSITAMASLALIGLISIQVYWINNSVEMGGAFEQNVNEALNNVVNGWKSNVLHVSPANSISQAGMRFYSPVDSAKAIPCRQDFTRSAKTR